MVNGMEIELRDRAVERQPLMEGDSKVCFLIKSQLNFQFTERGFFFFFFFFTCFSVFHEVLILPLNVANWPILNPNQIVPHKRRTMISLSKLTKTL